jgi:hypothetical protein
MKTLRRLLFSAILMIPFLTLSHLKTYAQWNDKDRDQKFESARYDRAAEARFDRDHDYRSGDPDSPRAPLDGGISLLLAAGIGLGVRKAAQRNKMLKEKNPDVTGE